VTMEAGPTLLAMHESTELLQVDVAGLEASMTHKVETEVFEAAVASLVAADAALTAEVAGKQPQLGVGFVEGGHSLLENGAIKAIKGTAPVEVTSTPTHVEVAMGQAYFDALAAKADLHALNLLKAEVVALANDTENEIAQLEAADEALQAAIDTKAPQSALNDTDQALAALTVEVAGKQSQLLAGDVEGGTPLLLFAAAEASGECTTCPEGTVS
jgi:hypothetical protein